MFLKSSLICLLSHKGLWQVAAAPYFSSLYISWEVWMGCRFKRKYVVCVWKGSFLIRSSVLFWYFLISLRATVPGRKRLTLGTFDFGFTGTLYFSPVLDVFHRYFRRYPSPIVDRLVLDLTIFFHAEVCCCWKIGLWLIWFAIMILQRFSNGRFGNGSVTNKKTLG